jgi:hypothetical protein
VHGVLVGNPKGKEIAYMEDISIEGKIITKWKLGLKLWNRVSWLRIQCNWVMLHGTLCSFDKRLLILM